MFAFYPPILLGGIGATELVKYAMIKDDGLKGGGGEFYPIVSLDNFGSYSILFLAIFDELFEYVWNVKFIM